MPGCQLLNASNLRICYDAFVVFEDISFSIRRGEILAFMGKSGCGKTTLLKAIVGQATVASGVIEGLDGLAGDVSLLYQSPYAFPWLTVQRNIQEATGLSLKETAERLEELNMEKAALRYPFELSGGMLRRLGLLMSLWGSHRLVLLDEPFAGLDDWTRILAFRAVEAAYAQGKTVVMATHSAEEAVALADRIYAVGGSVGITVLEDGPGLDRPRYESPANPLAFHSAVAALRSKFGSWLRNVDR